MKVMHLVKVSCLAAFAAAGEHADSWVSALESGDECSDGASCAMHALQVRGRMDAMQGGLDEGAALDDEDPDPKFTSGVIDPLKSVVKEIRTKMPAMLTKAVEAKKAAKPEPSVVLGIAADIRKLVEDLVPTIVKARDASAALDLDERTTKRSQATVAQDQLVMMQTYWGWAYPIIFDQVNAAYGGGEPGVSPKVMMGIKGSLKFLKPVLQLAWKVEKFMLPVVQGLVASTGSNSPQVMEKAACASDYASGLGDITVVYAQLANAELSCEEGSTDKELAQQCARDVVSGLESVADTIAQASKAMWECFGISWQCAEVFNSGLQGLIAGMSTSLEIASGCEKGPETCSADKAFTAFGSIINAVGAFETIMQQGTCQTKGNLETHFLNPYAATPAELKPALRQLTAAEDVPTLTLAQVSGEGFDAELEKKLDTVAKDLEDVLNAVLESTVASLDSKDTKGLAQTTQSVLDVLGRTMPVFFDLIKETGALKEDPSLKGLYGGMADLAQQDIIAMMEFTLDNAPKAVYQIAGAEGGLQKSDGFMQAVALKLMKAQTFLAGALNNAWDGLKLQLPRIEVLANSSNSEDSKKMARWANCAGDYASSLGALTGMYSNLVTSEGDCNVSSPDFLAVGCETDLLDSFASIQNVVTKASKMMSTCFKSTWECSTVTSEASMALLSAMTQAISMKDLCKETDPVSHEACASTASSLLGNLGTAAEVIRTVPQQCGGM
eukprot:TRINITY_DN6551_c0_g1_i9.p1 TRINITY_DN6551_c0_g1~~TRINITY_DN6551_c0_g1_i9.p1  ORF type:complete len:726 (+),score=178.87 TRINITY_DN6551_c0_g1_i9:104-2281(+)